MAGFADKDPRNGPWSTGKRPFTLSNTLKTLSSFGMRYDDMILRQSQAIGPLEDQYGYGIMNPMGVDNDDMYAAFAALSMADTTMRKNIPFFDQQYAVKRDELRRFSVNDEIEDILDILCDETIVYDNKNFFGSPEILGVEVADGVLTIRSVKENEDDDNNLYRGISYRKFNRKFTLADDIIVKDAKLQDGLLKISLEKIIPEEKKPRLIEVK